MTQLALICHFIAGACQPLPHLRPQSDTRSAAHVYLIRLQAAAIVVPIQQGVQHGIATPLGGVPPVQALVSSHKAPQVVPLPQHCL